MSLSTLIMRSYQWSLRIIHKIEKSIACLASFLQDPQELLPWVQTMYNGLGLPRSVTNQKTVLQTSLQDMPYRCIFSTDVSSSQMTLAFVELLKKKLAKNIIAQINQQCTFSSSYTHIFINFNIATGKVDSNYESFSPWTHHHGNRSTFLLSVSGPQFVLEQTRASRKA